MSLRYKILTALTMLPLAGLTLFLFIAVNTFEKDKIAYVFDSSLSFSKTKAQRVRAEVDSLISASQAILYGYSPDSRSLADSSNSYFNQEDKFQALKLYALNSDLGQYEQVIGLQKPEGEKLLIKEQDNLTDLIQSAAEETVVIKRPEGAHNIILALRFGDVTDPKHIVAIAVFKAGQFEMTFNESGGFASFLVRDDGARLFGNDFVLADKSLWDTASIYKSLGVGGIPEGIAEVKAPNGDTYLASYISVGVGKLHVLSMVDKQKALVAVKTLLRKSFLFFLTVLSITTIISVLASNKLTGALRYLLVATKKVTEGDFNVRVNVKTNDEIGTLGASFNTMAEEVAKLMRDTADKARMETELATAKTVQETLFPEPSADIGPVQIAGHYQSASECGGDWWYYCENGDKVYLWIGDATGHGAPAALITSAARAVASCIQSGPAIDPGTAMGILNRAIHDASKGRMMMTFFLATIDKNTGIMEYANASHEAPLLLRQSDVAPTRSDFEPLNDINNPRLGERPDVKFKTSSVQLNPGDQVVFYTDGVTDLHDPEKKAWGERRFVKSLSKELFESASTKDAVDGVINTLYAFRDNAPLDDDVTLILAKYKGAA
jgi:phosphoserine phosphatase RsbU/P